MREREREEKGEEAGQVGVSKGQIFRGRMIAWKTSERRVLKNI